MPAKNILLPFPYLDTTTNLQNTLDTEICCILNFKGGARERRSRYGFFVIKDSITRLNERAVDNDLSAKIESELRMEKEMRDSEKLPASLSDYLDSSSFEVSYVCLQLLLGTKCW